MANIKKISPEEYESARLNPEIEAISTLQIGEVIQITNSKYKCHLAQVIQGYKKTILKSKRFITHKINQNSYLIKRAK